MGILLLFFIEGLIDAAGIEQTLLGFLITQSERVLKHPCATIHEFGICQLHLDHAVAFDATQTDHQRGGDHIEHHLLSRAALHATGACDELRADDGLNGELSSLGQRGIGITGDTTRQQTILTSLSDSAYHIGCRARGSNTNYGFSTA